MNSTTLLHIQIWLFRHITAKCDAESLQNARLHRQYFDRHCRRRRQLDGGYINVSKNKKGKLRLYRTFKITVI